jgi:glycosyltransferase involved in cell wall biosynthesis
MKHSVFSITHSEHLVRYFSETDKLFYLSHGVNTNYFKPNEVRSPDMQLLMVANNGLAGDYGIDRKGFGIGIEAAKRLGLPITIVGTQSNAKFFALHPELQYDKLSVLATNPTEEEVLELYQSSHIFLHPSMIEAGTPNLTLLEAAACCLPIVGGYYGTKDIKGLYRSQRTVESVIEGIEYIMDNYHDIVCSMKEVRKQYDWKRVCSHLNKMYLAVRNNDNSLYPTKTVNELYQKLYS